MERAIFNNRVKDIFFYGGVALACLLPLFVFLWMLLTGLKTQADHLAIPPKLIFAPTLENFKEVFGQNHLLRYIKNSLIVAAVSVCVSLLFGLPAAYGIARFRMQKLGIAILIARLVPFISYLISWFMVFRKLPLVDTYIPLLPRTSSLPCPSSFGS